MFSPGDRVNHNFLGNGEVTEVINSNFGLKEPMLYMVKFDTRPAIEYNMGENPTLAFPEDLREIHTRA
jgi:hypothetical protein